MGAEVAAFAGAAAVWAGAAPVSRALPGGWTDILLVNAGSAVGRRQAWPGSLPHLPRRCEPAPSSSASSVPADRSNCRSTRRPAPVWSARATQILTAIAADGAVGRGQDIVLSGTGRVVVEHGIGPIAVWLAADGVSPWPDTAVQQVRPPARLALGGAAMALGLKQETLLQACCMSAPPLRFWRPWSSPGGRTLPGCSRPARSCMSCSGPERRNCGSILRRTVR